MEILEPRVSKRERKLHLSYELPNRIHCSCIYPLSAPNGSAVVLYGHDRGVRVLWRGGRRRKEAANRDNAPQTNGVGKSQEVIMIDDDDEQSQQHDATDDENDYEAYEDEQDPDCPYPTIIQDLDIDLGTEVLRMAVPTITSTTTSQIPGLLKTHMVLAVACADRRIPVMTIPLKPPESARKHEYFENEVTELQLQGTGSTCRDLSVKILPEDQQPSAKEETASIEGRILVASISESLSIWNLSFTQDGILQSPRSLQPMVHMAVPGSTISFQASLRTNLLLLGERAGAVRIFDLSMEPAPARRRSSEESQASATSLANGKWVMSFLTPFCSPKDEHGQALPRRKKILDATWVLSGRAVMVLLEDGEWGIWELSGTQSGKNLQDFALSGFLGSSSTAEVSEPRNQKRGGSKLAPMTPNTRKAKSEKLFRGTLKAPGAAATGGIPVSTTTSRSGQVDESLIMWYGSEVYSISSVQTFWQRSMTNTGGMGSLYAPGLTHISDINLMDESITSISQFATESTTSSLGQINTHRDLLVSAEHRFIVLQHLRKPTQAKELFRLVERPASRDQHMLDAGDLDLGGMDRMLDSMAGNGRTRRVGFAP